MLGIPCRTTLFCDFDGPIVDVSDRYYATYRMGIDQMMQMFTPQTASHCSILTKEQFWYLKQQRIPDFEIALRSGIPDRQVETFLSIVRTIVNQPSLLHKDKLQPGVRWALELMNSQGVRLVLVTLRSQYQVEELLNHYRLDHLFKAVWGTQDIAAAYCNSSEGKTALLANAWMNDCQRYGEPHTSWMIGDTEADILAGKAHNIATVALTCGIRSRTYLSQYKPDHICDDLVSVTHSLVNYRHNVPSSVPYL